MQECWKKEFDARPTAAKIVRRLVDPPIGAKPTEPGMDWDDTFISRLPSFSPDGLLRYLLNFARPETVEGTLVVQSEIIQLIRCTEHTILSSNLLK
jgi:hypothetical protein